MAAARSELVASAVGLAATRARDELCLPTLQPPVPPANPALPRIWSQRSVAGARGTTCISRRHALSETYLDVGRIIFGMLDHEPDDPALAREVINLIQKLNDRVAPRRLRANPQGITGRARRPN